MLKTLWGIAAVVCAGGAVVGLLAAAGLLAPGVPSDQPLLPPLPMMPLAADVTRVLARASTLQAIADRHGGSRSVALAGHAAAADYVLAQMRSLQGSFVVWEEHLDVPGQVDTSAPFLRLYSNDNHESTLVAFEPRLDFTVMRGSGSADVKKARLHTISSCDPNAGSGTMQAELLDKNDKDTGSEWVALIGPSSNLCTPCERIRIAVRQGASAAIVYSSPAYNSGFPHSMAPSPGDCGYFLQKEFSKIAVLSLSDKSAFSMLRQTTELKRKARIDLNVHSMFRQIATRNIIAESCWLTCVAVPAGPGINDNGIGSMALLEFAQQLHESGQSHLLTQKLRLAWWTDEELGHSGASHYIKNMRRTNPKLIPKHKANIDVDMISSPNFIRGVLAPDTSAANSTVKQRTQTLSTLFARWFAGKNLPIQYVPLIKGSETEPIVDAGIPCGGVVTGADEIKTPKQAEMFGGLSGVAMDRELHIVT
eukprot:jgi/Hompol1/1297/HPOL_004740-RA